MNFKGSFKKYLRLKLTAHVDDVLLFLNKNFLLVFSSMTKLESAPKSDSLISKSELWRCLLKTQY